MSEHKYLQLASQLREQIQEGVYQRGQRLPGELTLAQQAGCSRQTVRQAIALLEEEGLLARRQGSGTYVRQTSVRRAKTRNVAVVTTYIGEYIFPDILQGIERTLSQNRYASLLFATRNRVDRERQVLTELLQKPIDGLIVEGTKTALPNPNIDLYRQFESLGLPVVFINGVYAQLPEAVYVMADDQEGGRMACQELLDRGLRRIAGIFKSDDIQGHRRYAGYSQALREAGLPVVDDRVAWYTTEDRVDLLEASIPALVRGCDGLVCYNDQVACQVLELLRRRGEPVPQLASFDHSVFAQVAPTPFLSLANPKEQIGRLAAEKLLNMLRGRRETPALLPWRRESGPVRTTETSTWGNPVR